MPHEHRRQSRYRRPFRPEAAVSRDRGGAAWDRSARGPQRCRHRRDPPGAARLESDLLPRPEHLPRPAHRLCAPLRADQYQSLLLRKEDQENKQIDQFNKAQEKASDLFVTQYGIDENAKRALEVAKMSGDYQIKVAQIHAATAGKPGETERLLGKYHSILAKEGPEAANKFMGDVERVRGAGKPQNIMSYEEAMKIVNADVMNASKSIEDKKRMAIEMMQSDPMRAGMPGQNTVANPFKLSPEAAAALKQYGGK